MVSVRVIVMDATLRNPIVQKNVLDRPDPVDTVALRVYRESMDGLDLPDLSAHPDLPD
ncbi:Hypothetical protein POVN_LOCUS96 [uncultured virus]|nr:Hypothetical protein POVN_LOCUS96 [uncultured virus]